jgi:hypothetical protein
MSASEPDIQLVRVTRITFAKNIILKRCRYSLVEYFDLFKSVKCFNMKLLNLLVATVSGRIVISCCTILGNSSSFLILSNSKKYREPFSITNHFFRLPQWYSRM